MAHAIKDRDEQLLGVMLVARDVQALGRVQSMLNYSRKLVALGRLSAGVAHEVKNPLNAMTIHLELLRAEAGRPRRRGKAAGRRGRRRFRPPHRACRRRSRARARPAPSST